MAFETERSAWTRGQADVAQIDVGLRQYMLRVYNYMASGLALTGLTAALVANTPALWDLFFQVGPVGRAAPTMLGWIAIIAPIGLVLALSFGIAKMRASTAQGLFWLYAGLMGISLSSI